MYPDSLMHSGATLNVADLADMRSVVAAAGLSKNLELFHCRAQKLLQFC